MAVYAPSSKELPEMDSFSKQTLESRYSEAITWSNEAWANTPLANSKFRRLCNSTKFWRGKLQEAFSDCNVILTLHAEASTKFLTTQQITTDIEHQFPGILITDYNRFRNPRYLCVEFANTEMRNHVLKYLRVIQNFEVLFLSWAPINNNVTIRVHWLPKRVEIAKIGVVLSRFFDCKFVKSETAVHDNGKAYGCGISTFVGLLKPGVLMDSVPHTIFIAGLESLWTIPSRPPLCLQCDTVGHKAAECTVSRCKLCNRRKPKDHVCVPVDQDKPSYAQKLKNVDNYNDDVDDYNFDDPSAVSQEALQRNVASLKRGLDKSLAYSVADKENLLHKMYKTVTVPFVSNAVNSSHIPPRQPLPNHNSLPQESGSSPTAASLMEVVGTGKAGGISKDADGFTQVHRKIKANRIREPKDKEKSLKSLAVVPAATVSKVPLRMVTRSENSLTSIGKAVSEDNFVQTSNNI